MFESLVEEVSDVGHLSLLESTATDYLLELLDLGEAELVEVWDVASDFVVVDHVLVLFDHSFLGPRCHQVVCGLTDDCADARVKLFSTCTVSLAFGIDRVAERALPLVDLVMMFLENVVDYMNEYYVWSCVIWERRPPELESVCCVVPVASWVSLRTGLGLGGSRLGDSWLNIGGLLHQFAVLLLVDWESEHGGTQDVRGVGD